MSKTELVVTGQRALVQAEIDTQVATAKNWPRNAKLAINQAKTLATMNRTVAELCRYKKPVGYKDGVEQYAEGPSIRLAEILASQWGNLRIATRVVEVGEERVTVEGACHDLETNVAYMAQATRSIMTSPKHGKPMRYGENMIDVTIAGISSIARRNAIFEAIPRALVSIVEEAARKASGFQMDETTKEGLPPKAKAQIAELLGRLEALGVTERMALDAVGISHRDEMTRDGYDHLLTMGVAIRDGETTVDEAFGGKTAKQAEPESDESVLDADELDLDAFGVE